MRILPLPMRSMALFAGRADTANGSPRRQQAAPEGGLVASEYTNSCHGSGRFQQLKILGQEVNRPTGRNQADTEVQMLLKAPIASDNIERLRLRDGLLPVRRLTTFRP